MPNEERQPINPPIAVRRVMASLELTEAELRDYVRVQRRAFNEVKYKATDFRGWVAVKLSCSRSAALKICTWAEIETFDAKVSRAIERWKRENKRVE